MKTPSAIAASLLIAAGACPAQEANPFVNQAPEKAAPKSSGEPFVGVVEHVLVPPDLLNAWLGEHPMKGDASELRKAVEGWIGEGRATLDHTAVTTGLAGWESRNESIREQIYATEYEPAKPGQWPMPTAFETRNLGYSFSGGAAGEEGVMTMQAEVEYVRKLNSRAWNELAESTRQPDDVFIPGFRSIRVSQRASNGNADPRQNDDPFAASDPFIRPVIKPPGYSPDRIHLIARATEFIPDPKVAGAAGQEGTRDDEGVTGPDHLIFYRGSVGELPNDPLPAITGNHLLSCKLVRVDHRVFSEWIQRTPLMAIPSGAEAASSAWLADGTAEIVVSLSATQLAGNQTTLESAREFSYPTEWEPGKHSAGEDGKPGQVEFSTGTSYETRNTGSTVDSVMLAEPSGPVLKYSIERVIHADDSIHHRIPRDGQWLADITFPVFVTNRWNSTLRVERGKWTLVASGADIDGEGKLDPTHAVLAFIKVE